MLIEFNQHKNQWVCGQCIYFIFLKAAMEENKVQKLLEKPFKKRQRVQLS